VVIGGGQAGLAMSHCLTRRSVDHVVLERDETASSWRTQRWDSLRLLTPNWLSRLPGWSYRGDDPDGYMTAGEVAIHLDDYRRSFDAPVRPGTAVVNIESSDSDHVVATADGSWRARAVVLATGACSDPYVPPIANDMPGHLGHVSPIHYRNPDALAGGGVLVVGASASGLQIADELSRAGRDVMLAVGDHVRLPRTYRGMDIHWWLDAVGQLDERWDEVPDIGRARRLPSLQLIGTPERRDLDLNAVAATGVRVVGRLVGCSAHRAQFSGSFANMCASADLKQGRLLDLCDSYATEHDLDDELVEPCRPAPTAVGRPPLDADLRPIGTIVWATGFRPTYPFLDPRLLDRRGRLVHDGGLLPAPGMYVLGLPFQRRRKSSFLDGVGPDADELATHLVGHLETTARRSTAGLRRA
ncbi:MAG TPA: NAD(P)-binding domain-containing protein, partial [Ilumatobacteraceae bacterium]|nr:NAD(P)-binding domain-containing protein [Ilumatobacteraceae bacterium]